MAYGDAVGRTFTRGMVSDVYSLEEFRRAQLAAPRVRDGEFVSEGNSLAAKPHSSFSHNKWRLSPGDEPFLTQTLQMHFVHVPPGGSNKGHGHQNEAAFYILQGVGHEIHDDIRHDWEAGDVVIVHTDSVHQHFNDGDHDFVALVVKAKATWTSFGLIQQGSSAPFERDGFGPPEDWSQLWTPGVEQLRKVVKPQDRTWEHTPDGWVRVRVSSETTEVRCFSLDIYEQWVAPGSRTAKRWHIADEVYYVLSGEGYALQWEVAADIQERYYARVAYEPSRWDFKQGDMVYVPPNTVHQLFCGGGETLLLLSVQNRLMKHLGYDKIVYLEKAPAGDVPRRPD